MFGYYSCYIYIVFCSQSNNFFKFKNNSTFLYDDRDGNGNALSHLVNNSIMTTTNKSNSLHSKLNQTFFKNTLTSNKCIVKATCTLISTCSFEVEARYHHGLNQLFKAIPSRKYSELLVFNYTAILVIF